jgi:sarcosine oxidase subunit alpha
MIRFTFDGRAYQGREGDTLAAALLREGVHLMSRSFKYHRPRGVLAAGAEEPNALVEIDRGNGRRTPNLRATQIEIYEGLVARSQNRTPSLRFDIGAINDVLSPLLSAGFYYKTFMWPASFWARWYEPAIRRAAGLGRAPDAADTDRYANRYTHCDVLIVGAGPAGLQEAVAAAAKGARVILCDEQPDFGGSLLASRAPEDHAQIGSWIETLAANPRVRLLRRTTAFGYYGHNFVGLAERLTDHLQNPDSSRPRERMWQVRAGEVVVAAGAIERPLLFAGNDRPGVMLAGAARAFANRWQAPPGQRAVIVTACDTAYAAARDLREAGLDIALIADLRATSRSCDGIRIVSGARVLGTGGRRRVRFIDLQIGASRERIACDVVAMSGGWTPSIHLYAQARGKPKYDPALGAFVPGAPVSGLRCIGGCAGGLDAAFTSETILEPDGNAFVDFQNDVKVKDLRLAAREGFRSIEHVKRYTTTGMATDQGKTSNINALGVLGETIGRELAEIGLTTYRPPYTPVSFGAFAGPSRGELFDPVRTTPCHAEAQAAGAVFEDVGAWKRARYFPRGAESMDEAVARECRTVRATAGMFDATTLGKIEVVGPDAATFMERMYVNAWTKLAPGRCRYGVMLGENGFIRDDGVVGRLAQDRFHVTTTTGGAAGVLGLMEDYRQTEWPDLKVWLTSVTEQWAVIAVQGPRARAVLEPLVDGLDISAAAMPHMAVRAGTFQGVAMRLFRVSFTGELGFEVNVPADHGATAWRVIAARVAAENGCSYGTETMHVLRAEKGFIIVGQETDGTVTPEDVGLGWAIGRNKHDFVGKRSLARPAMTGTRRELVGLLAHDGKPLEEGAQLVAIATSREPEGHVTSAYPATSLGHPIALGLLAGGRARIGQAVYVFADGAVRAAKIVSPVFTDPAGARLDV